MGFVTAVFDHSTFSWMAAGWVAKPYGWVKHPSLDRDINIFISWRWGPVGQSPVPSNLDRFPGFIGCLGMDNSAPGRIPMASTSFGWDGVVSDLVGALVFTACNHLCVAYPGCVCDIGVGCGECIALLVYRYLV